MYVLCTFLLRQGAATDASSFVFVKVRYFVVLGWNGVSAGAI